MTGEKVIYSMTVRVLGVSDLQAIADVESDGLAIQRSPDLVPTRCNY